MPLTSGLGAHLKLPGHHRRLRRHDRHLLSAILIGRFIARRSLLLHPRDARQED
jgi:hypothetical protein